jgi:hypothetical protein
MPNLAEERRKWLRVIVGQVINKIEPKLGKHVVCTTLGQKTQEISLAEVKLDSSEI